MNSINCDYCNLETKPVIKMDKEIDIYFCSNCLLLTNQTKLTEFTPLSEEKIKSLKTDLTERKLLFLNNNNLLNGLKSFEFTDHDVLIVDVANVIQVIKKLDYLHFPIVEHYFTTLFLRNNISDELFDIVDIDDHTVYFFQRLHHTVKGEGIRLIDHDNLFPVSSLMLTRYNDELGDGYSTISGYLEFHTDVIVAKDRLIELLAVIKLDKKKVGYFENIESKLLFNKTKASKQDLLLLNPFPTVEDSLCNGSQCDLSNPLIRDLTIKSIEQVDYLLLTEDTKKETIKITKVLKELGVERKVITLFPYPKIKTIKERFEEFEDNE